MNIQQVINILNQTIPADVDIRSVSVCFKLNAEAGALCINNAAYMALQVPNCEVGATLKGGITTMEFIGTPPAVTANDEPAIQLPGVVETPVQLG
ncbi:hypothetical protein CPT_Sonora_004 [Stenotrophomonas phage Sonora]|nr:hypothetical protein CPT_Sonora_004 [Stenotrophomonas phage Sonora]